ncbi:MAG TPA: Xaa-Pro aminopeptidase, partial [Terriglobia bacterium]|nr:Xaa-Pro aminopeptidase [Terriglobia bacterium]
MFRSKMRALSGVLLSIALTIPVGALEKEPLSEYASRRARVVEQIKGNTLILFGKANIDLVKFRQEDNFYYLTGFSEPNAVLLIDATGDQPEEILFVEPRNLGQEKWTGVTMSAGAEGQKATGVRSVQILGDMAPAMTRVLQKGRKLFTLTSDARTSDELRKLPMADVQNVEPIIASLRVRKSPTELALMEKTVKITLSGHEAAARTIAPGVWEYEVEAMVRAAA